MTQEEIIELLKLRSKLDSYRQENKELQSQIPHWISVEDELPPRFPLDPSVSMNVLTYGLRTIVSWYYYDKDVWAGNTEVTHWMPLPSPPKEISGNLGGISPNQKGGEE